MIQSATAEISRLSKIPLQIATKVHIKQNYSSERYSKVNKKPTIHKSSFKTWILQTVIFKKSYTIRDIYTMFILKYLSTDNSNYFCNKHNLVSSVSNNLSVTYY